MPEINSVPTRSKPIGQYPGLAPSSAHSPKLLDRLREALRSRHSCAPPLLEGGYDIRTVQELLGHKDVSTAYRPVRATVEQTGEKVTTMKMSVVLAHPDPRSFNHAIAQTVVERLEKKGHRVFFHDLYREKFDPLLAKNEIPNDAALSQTIREQGAEIAKAEGIIIVHPNWWGQPPAILKGWIDRVMRPGIAYEFLEGDSGEGIPKGLLRAKAAIVFNTSNTEPERERGVFGDPLETIWKNCIFGLCGVTLFYRRTFSVVITSTEAQRQQWLDEVRARIDTVFPNEESREKII